MDQGPAVNNDTRLEFPAAAMRQSRQALRKTLMALVVITMAAAVAAPMSVRAADLGGIAETAVTVPKTGTLQKVLQWALSSLKWLARFAPYVQPLIEAIQELLRLLQDAKRSAEAQKKLEELAHKLDELEAKLAAQVDSRGEIKRLQVLLKKLNAEVRSEVRNSPSYQTCGAYRFRNKQGECVDARSVN